MHGVEWTPEPFGARSVEELEEWTSQAFIQLQATFAEGRNYFRLHVQHEEPDKLVEGLVVLADGADWNPGGGAGVYAYYGGTWNKLG